MTHSSSAVRWLTIDPPPACAASNWRKPKRASYDRRPAEPPRYPNRRAGKNSTARSSANSASQAIPTARNGSDNSHSRGHRKIARTASGQQNTKRRDQPTIKNRTFTRVSPRFLDATLAYPQITDVLSTWRAEPVPRLNAQVKRFDAPLAYANHSSTSPSQAAARNFDRRSSSAR